MRSTRELLAQSAWIRALAGSLVRDAASADDLAQETWLAMLRRPPPAEKPLRPWIVRMMRNLLGQRVRSEQSRARREHERSRREALPSSAELVERTEVQRALVDEVLALDEPYRSSVLLHYFEGLAVTTIATRRGIPDSTVRTQLARGREQLRRRMEARLGLEPKRLRAVLVPLALAQPALRARPGPWASATRYLLTMKTIQICAGVGAAALALLLGVALLAEGSQREDTVAVAPEAGTLEGSLPADASTPLGQSPESTASERVVAPRTTSVTAEARPTPDLGRIRGRFVFADGTPAEGVTCALHGSVASERRKLKHGLPDHWQDLETASAADGTFTFAFEPPPAFQFSMRTDLPGFCETRWGWSALSPGTKLDLGEIELRRPGSIEGYVVDEAGNVLVSEGWRVYAERSYAATDGRENARRHDVIDADTGRFRIEGMPPGMVTLRAHAAIANWIDGPTIRVVQGQTVEANVVYSGPDNSRRITVLVSNRPFGFVRDPEPQSIRLLGADGELRTARKIPGSAQSYSFEDLDPGLYRLEIDDPIYAYFCEGDIRPGTRVKAHLRGPSTVSCNVVDRDSLEPIELYSLRILSRKSRSSPNELEYHDGTAPLPGGRIEGIFPGDYTLTIEAEGYSRKAMDVKDLVAGEHRVVTFHLGGTTSIAGQIVKEDGQPVVGHEVLLLRTASVDDSHESAILRAGWSSSDEARSRIEIDATMSDDHGQFEFELARPGTFVVHASAGPSLAVSSDVIEIRENEVRNGVALVLPAQGYLQGQLLLPEGASTAELVVTAWPIASEVKPKLRENVAQLDDSGAFRLGPLPPGPTGVYLALVSSRQVGAVWGGVDLSKRMSRIGTVDIEAGTVVEHEFSVEGVYPGTLSLRAFRGDEPAVGVTAWLSNIEGDQSVALEYAFDGEGRVDDVPLFPGEWFVTISSEGPSGWHYSHASPVVIESLRDLTTVLRFETSTGEIKLLDSGTRAPLVHETIHLASDRFQEIQLGLSRTLETDENGMVQLELATGRYQLRRTDSSGRPDGALGAVELEWTGDGPVQATLEL